MNRFLIGSAACALLACSSSSNTARPDAVADASGDAAIAQDSGGDAPTADAAQEDALGDDTTSDASGDGGEVDASVPLPETLRFATFNVSLFRDAEGELLQDLEAGDDQARTVAEIIQRTAPDVLLLNEFDYDSEGRSLDVFADAYLNAELADGVAPIDYPYRWVFASNTGVPSGFDLDNADGRNNAPGTVPYGNDALGFGVFEGQYAFAVLSRFPAATAPVREYRDFLWRDLPGAALPDEIGTAEPDDWFTPEELDVMRLSSKNHVALPIAFGASAVYVVAAHPTPPGFDGREDRNGRRNADEIRLLAELVETGEEATWLVDDSGVVGGLAGASFVVMGDLNDDPADGSSHAEGIEALLNSPRVQDPLPTSEGGPEQSALQGQANATQVGDPAYDTADFRDDFGNVRVDYALPSADLDVTGAGVFWPLESDPTFALVGTFPYPGSDHRLVWVDIRTPE